MEKKSDQISNTRLFSQRIVTSEFRTPKEIVKWMGAMQAQDFQMVKWAVGLRLAGSNEQTVESSFNKGEIIRTHVLRPTWHLIIPDDIYWMIKLSAVKLRSAMKLRNKHLGLTESIINKTNSIIENALGDGNNLTRDELAALFARDKINTDENRLSHIMFSAELEGIICSGPIKSKKLTYSLLADRVPVKKQLSRDESIAELAKRYFTSHCPATIQDFAWWSNLSLTEIRKAVDSVKSEFITETTASGQYLYPDSYTAYESQKTSVYLLPAYDEFLISYKDRSNSLSLVNNRKTVSNNGIFYPPIVVNGQVSGLWQRTSQKEKVMIRLNLFENLNKTVMRLIEAKAAKYGEFLGKEIVIDYLSR